MGGYKDFTGDWYQSQTEELGKVKEENGKYYRYERRGSPRGGDLSFGWVEVPGNVAIPEARKEIKESEAVLYPEGKQEKVEYNFKIPETVSVDPLKNTTPARPGSGADPSVEQKRILDSMRRNVETPQTPEYDYSLEMPTKPASSNIKSERDITGRSSTGAGLQKQITPYDQQQAALRRMLQRGY